MIANSSRVDEHGNILIPQQIMESADLRIGDVLVVEHAQPGLIRFRLRSPGTADDLLEQVLIEPATDGLAAEEEATTEQLAPEHPVEAEEQGSDG